MFISANPGSTNSVLVPNLSPLSAYAFRIRAENDVGKSDYSKEIAVTTTIEGMFMCITVRHARVSQPLCVYVCVGDGMIFPVE